MADEQGPKEGEAVTEAPGGTRPERKERPHLSSVAELMAKGTATSELRAEMRRAIGIAKSVGIRLERQVDRLKKDELPPAEWERLWATYSLNLQRATECQLRLEKEARLRLKDVPTDALNGHVRTLLERQMAGIVTESMRGSKARRKNRVGA